MIDSVQDAAKRVIQEHEMLVLSVQDREVFVEALLNPPVPSDKLLAAAQRYQQNIEWIGDTDKQVETKPILWEEEEEFIDMLIEMEKETESTQEE